MKVQTFFWKSCFYLVLFGQVRGISAKILRTLKNVPAATPISDKFVICNSCYQVFRLLLPALG